ncbi:hypothetical protein J6590_054013 [Homalodisca vitripennis]|nr:hypothetical protein J6590_054013 [Homalodisca vitripennis]
MDAGSLHGKESIPSCSAPNGGFMQRDLHVAPPVVLYGTYSTSRPSLRLSENRGGERNCAWNLRNTP